MEIERYFIRVNPEKMVSKILEERVHRAYFNLSFAERLIREKLQEEGEKINLNLWIGNSTKSLEELVEFTKLLKSKGMEEKDINFVKELIEESRNLLGFY